MKPIFALPSQFGEHLLALTTALVRVLGSAGVPDLVMASISEQSTLTPWLPGAPLTGLVRWSEHLTDPSWSAIVHDPINDGGRLMVSIYVDGRLDGLDVAIVGTTYRELPGLDWNLRGRRQPVDPDAIRELAALETPIDLTPEPAP